LRFAAAVHRPRAWRAVADRGGSEGVGAEAFARVAAHLLPRPSNRFGELFRPRLSPLPGGSLHPGTAGTPGWAVAGRRGQAALAEWLGLGLFRCRLGRGVLFLGGEAPFLAVSPFFLLLGAGAGSVVSHLGPPFLCEPLKGSEPFRHCMKSPRQAHALQRVAIARP